MKYKKNIFCFGIVVIFLLLVSNVEAVSPDFTYHVKAGDQNTYEVTSNYFNGLNIPYPITWQDGSRSNITINTGFTYTVVVCNITGSGTNEVLYTKEIINGKSTVCESVFGTAIAVPIIPVTDNVSYYQNLNNSDEISSQKNSSYELNGNILTHNFTVNTGISINTDDSSININSGWMTSFYSNTKDYNGTLISENGLKLVTTKKNGLPGFELVPTLLVFGIVVPVVLLKRKRKLRY